MEEFQYDGDRDLHRCPASEGMMAVRPPQKISSGLNVRCRWTAEQGDVGVDYRLGHCKSINCAIVRASRTALGEFCGRWSFSPTSTGLPAEIAPPFACRRREYGGQLRISLLSKSGAERLDGFWLFSSEIYSGWFLSVPVGSHPVDASINECTLSPFLMRYCTTDTFSKPQARWGEALVGITSVN